MVITKEQIQRFFDQQYTKEETETIARYLEENPDILEKYIQQDWADADGQTRLPGDTSRDMLTVIRSVIFPVRNKKAQRIVVWTTAAAIILLIASVFLLPTHEKSVVATATKTVPKNIVTTPLTRTRINNTARDLSISLSDGTLVTLAPNSTLEYPENFPGNSRALVLKGQASFDVAKEKTRPFTVSAGPVLTTVLGTVFNILSNDKGVNIRLYSGKIRLQPKDGTLKGWQQPIVLLPGEQMEYMADKDLVEVSGFEKITAPAAKPTDLKNTNNDALVFDKQRLPEVLDRLADRYHTTITYDRKLIGDLYFSGTLLKSESLLTILEVITNMNGLMIVQKPNGFIIQKNIP